MINAEKEIKARQGDNDGDWLLTGSFQEEKQVKEVNEKMHPIKMHSHSRASPVIPKNANNLKGCH